MTDRIVSSRNGTIRKATSVLLAILLVILSAFAMADIKSDAGLNNNTTHLSVNTAMSDNGYVPLEGIEIFDAKIFPDSQFQKYIYQWLDRNLDGKLNENEIKATEHIGISDQQVTSLKGIEYFTELRSLSCSNNQLKTLDVSKNTKLQVLRCSNNKLTKLDVSKNADLTELSCDNNQLSQLDVSKNVALTKISCYNNQLTKLDVSKNTLLQELNCGNNRLTSLDIRKNTALTKLHCNDNQLSTLDVKNNIALTVLYCYYNNIATLDIGKNKSLTLLCCYHNHLSKLDISNNTALTEIRCHENQLTKLDTTKNTKLEELYCGNNQLNALDLSKNTQLRVLYCNYTRLSTLDVSKCTALANLVKASAPMEWNDFWGWWIDDGQGGFDFNQPRLLLDRTVKVTPSYGMTDVKVTSITLNKTKATLKKGKTLQLTVKKILPEDATDKSVSWKSSNKKVATVSSTGKVIAVGKGTCTITCTAKDGSKVKAKCKITVK